MKLRLTIATLILAVGMWFLQEPAASHLMRLTPALDRPGVVSQSVLSFGLVAILASLHLAVAAVIARWRGLGGIILVLAASIAVAASFGVFGATAWLVLRLPSSVAVTAAAGDFNYVRVAWSVATVSLAFLSAGILRHASNKGINLTARR